MYKNIHSPSQICMQPHNESNVYTDKYGNPHIRRWTHTYIHTHTHTHIQTHTHTYKHTHTQQICEQRTIRMHSRYAHRRNNVFRNKHSQRERGEGAKEREREREGVRDRERERERERERVTHRQLQTHRYTLTLNNQWHIFLRSLSDFIHFFSRQSPTLDNGIMSSSPHLACLK